jgi:hypothetical protein
MLQGTLKGSILLIAESAAPVDIRRVVPAMALALEHTSTLL